MSMMNLLSSIKLGQRGLRGLDPFTDTSLKFIPYGLGDENQALCVRLSKGADQGRMFQCIPAILEENPSVVWQVAALANGGLNDVKVSIISLLIEMLPNPRHDHFAHFHGQMVNAE